MRLHHNQFRFQFEFEENRKNLLIVERPEIFSKVVWELSEEAQEEESGFVLSENDKIIKKRENLNCVINPWEISLNEKKILNRLNEILKKEIQSSDLLLESNRIYALIEEFALHLLQNIDFELVYSDKTDVQNLLKFMDIRFNDVKVSHELLGYQCFVFVHLLSYLSCYEMKKLYEYMQYQKIPILLLESRQPKDIKEFSNIVIIDEDACEIMLDV